jgi:hypothetical protein
MKKALVLALVVLGVGATAFAGAFSGDFEVCARFNKTDLQVFDTTLSLDYTVGTFVFGINAIFDLNAFDNLYFEVDGTLGAFEFTSFLDFEPQTPAFMFFDVTGKISIGGATLFGVFAVGDVDGDPDTTGIGAGANFGLHGTVGDVSVTASMFFNMGDIGFYYWYYGVDTIFALDVYEECGVLYKPYIWSLVQSDCCLCWNAASIYVDFPFTCLDVTAWVSFSCTNGFNDFGVRVTGFGDIFPWLTISRINISFQTQTKSIAGYWDVIVGDLVCVTPYVSLEGGPWYKITGITLNALLLEYSYNGVTVKAGEIFDNTWRGGYLSNTRTYGFTLDGGLDYGGGCYYVKDYDEFLGIWIDGDSCCGGAYNIGVINFFNTALTTDFMDWAESVADFEMGIGPNVSIGLSMSLKKDGLQWFQICGGFSF